MPIPPKITFRLGALTEPLEAYCTANDVSPSEAARQAIAKMLGEKVPNMAVGNPMFVPKKKAKKGKRTGG